MTEQTDAAEVRCNCIVIWDLLNERHVWINGSLDGRCGHPPTGTPYTAVVAARGAEGGGGE